MAKVLVHNQLWTIVAAPLVDGAHSCLMLHCCDHRDTEDWAVALKNPFFLPPTIHVVTAALPEDDDDGAIVHKCITCLWIGSLPSGRPCASAQDPLSCCDKANSLITHPSKKPH